MTLCGVSDATENFKCNRALGDIFIPHAILLGSFVELVTLTSYGAATDWCLSEAKNYKVESVGTDIDA